ncbi:hypothetical protein PIB30_009167 [Stylosanthes scabra]|uniref:Uncharacterized protein n=1 Tax=Stylosanthes scabra TaxID=79078 RepID=A0ABU6Y6S8_9FABA|nr:hypothetical protein [Stylosanthes scabra]
MPAKFALTVEAIAIREALIQANCYGLASKAQSARNKANSSNAEHIEGQQDSGCDTIFLEKTRLIIRDSVKQEIDQSKIHKDEHVRIHRRPWIRAYNIGDERSGQIWSLAI